METNIHNQKGFSLIQVVVAMTVMSVMSLGLTTMIQNQSNTVFYLEDKMSHQNLKKEVETLLSDTTACTESLTNINVPVSIQPNVTEPFTIKDKTGVVLYNPSNNNRNKFDRLNISNISIQNLDIVGAAVTGKVNIKVDVRRQRGPANTNQALQSIVIEKEVAIDAARNVTDCVNSGNSEDNGCLRVVASYSNPLTSFSWGVRLVPIPPRRVPANIDAVIVRMRGNSTHHRSVDGTDYNCNSGSAQAAFKLDSIPINKFKPNFNITWTNNTVRNNASNLVYYNGVHIGTENFCGDARTSRPASSTSNYGRTLDVCPAPSDPAPGDITFYRYHKEL